MFKHDPTDTKPCWHMRLLVSALADGALAGIARWYTERHVQDCTQCQKGLATIIAVRNRLRTINEEHGEEIPLTAERWAAIEAGWEQADHRRTGTV